MSPKNNLKIFGITTCSQSIRLLNREMSAKKKLSTGKTHMAAMKEEKRSVTKNRDRIVERAKEFYEKLNSSDISNNSVIENEEFNEVSTTYTTQYNT